MIGRLTGKLVAAAPIPSVLVRAADVVPESFRRILVPLDGSMFSRAAAEFAFRGEGTSSPNSG